MHPNAVDQVNAIIPESIADRVHTAIQLTQIESHL
jgi:hypothetical protein